MGEQAHDREWDVDDPDVSELVTEDDTPLDSVFQEKQQRLLTSPLLDSWERRPFVAMANVGLFFSPDEPPLVPDMLLSMGVSLPADLAPKKNRSYFVWRFGKPPEVVVEVVSNREGRELDEKRAIYERIRVAHYVVFDPYGYAGDVRLRCFELAGERYVDRLAPRFEALGLSLVEWEGQFEDHHDRWLRWADLKGQVVPTGAERAQREREQAQREREQAQREREQAQREREQAQRERERADRLAARLRELGVDPDE